MRGVCAGGSGAYLWLGLAHGRVHHACPSSSSTAPGAEHVLMCCTSRNMQVIAETAQRLPAGGSVTTTMPLLSNMGPAGAKVRGVLGVIRAACLVC